MNTACFVASTIGVFPRKRSVPCSGRKIRKTLLAWFQLKNAFSALPAWPTIAFLLFRKKPKTKQNQPTKPKQQLIKEEPNSLLCKLTNLDGWQYLDGFIFFTQSKQSPEHASATATLMQTICPVQLFLMACIRICVIPNPKSFSILKITSVRGNSPSNEGNWLTATHLSGRQHLPATLKFSFACFILNRRNKKNLSTPPSRPDMDVMWLIGQG